MTMRAWIPPLGTLLLVGAASVLVWHASSLNPQATVGKVMLDPMPDEEAEGNGSPVTRDLRGRIDLDAALLARPLFAETRAPYTPPPKPEPEPVIVAPTPAPQPVPEPVAVAAPPPPPPEPPVLELRGTMEEGGIWHALLSRPGQNGVWLGTGDLIEDWHVAMIDSTFVLLRHGTVEHRVELMK